MSELSKKRRAKLQKKLNDTYGYQDHRDEDVEVREAGPHGRGLFAARQFTPGEIIVEINGQLHRQTEYAGSLFVMELDTEWLLEPDIPGCFVNHSCNPNSELIPFSKHSLGLVAICNIEPGIEIGYDYQWPAKKWVPHCHCKSPTCRGWMVAADQVEKMKRLVSKKKRAKKKKSSPRR